MKKLLSQAYNNPLLKGSFIVLVSTNITNVLSYLFQYLMLRLLTPDEYRILFALFSLFAIVGVFGGTMAQVGVKFSAELKAKEDFRLLTGLFKKLTIYNLLVALLIVSAFFVFGSNISTLLNIPVIFLHTFSLFIAASMVLGLPTTMLNGLLRFKSFGFVTIITGVFKLVIPIFIFYLGFGLVVIIWGLIFGAVLSSSLATYFLKKNLRRNLTEFSSSKIFKMAIPMFFISIFTILLFNIDVLLVNKFFDIQSAATYSSVALIGRIILYGAGAITVIVLPVVTEKFTKGHKLQKTLFLSTLLVVVMGMAGVLILYLFPDLINTYVFGGKYPDSVPFLWSFGVFMVLYALVGMLTSFFIGINKFYVSWVLLLGGLFQIIGITLFHSTLWQVIIVNIISMSTILLLYLLMLVNFFKNIKVSEVINAD